MGVRGVMMRGTLASPLRLFHQVPHRVVVVDHHRVVLDCHAQHFRTPSPFPTLSPALAPLSTVALPVPRLAALQLPHEAQVFHNTDEVPRQVFDVGEVDFAQVAKNLQAVLCGHLAKLAPGL